MMIYFVINCILMVILPFCWCISCAAWRRGYSVLQHLPFGGSLSDKHLKVSDLHFLMALAEINRDRHQCVSMAFDSLNSIPLKFQQVAFLSVYRETVIRKLGIENTC